MGICWMAQETQTGALSQPRGVGWGGRWEGGSKGRGYMCTYGWFMLRFDRKQQNSIKQLSFIKKKKSQHRGYVQKIVTVSWEEKSLHHTDFIFFNDHRSSLKRLIGWFLAVRGLCCCMPASSSCSERGYSGCGEQASHCRGFSCGAQAPLSRGMWRLPKAEIEPVCPAWTGRLSTARPPGKSITLILNHSNC